MYTATAPWILGASSEKNTFNTVSAKTFQALWFLNEEVKVEFIKAYFIQLKKKVDEWQSCCKVIFTRAYSFGLKHFY